VIRDLVMSLKNMGNPNELAAANHLLVAGLYVLIEADGSEIQDLLIEKGGEYYGELYESIRSRDFLSNLIEMNKHVDQDKKIFSNNIYSLVFKYDDLPKINNLEAKKSTVNIYDETNIQEHINRYFMLLNNWYDKYKRILSITSIRPLDISKSNKNKMLFLKTIPKVRELIEKHKLKSGKYIKLYINAPISEYMEASNLYLFPKIFNNNDSNVEIDGQLYGLSNANMGQNAKKPYLSHMTTSYKAPYQITLNEALDAYRLLSWLNSQNNQGRAQNDGYLPYEQSGQFTLLEEITGNMPAQYLHFFREKTGVVIDDYEVLSCAKKNLDKHFKSLNYLNLPKHEGRTITRMNQLEKLVDEVLFNNYLIRNYYNEPKSVSNKLSSRQAAIIQLAKNAFISFFKKSDDTALKKMIDKVSIEIVLEKLKQTDFPLLEYTSFARSLNLRFALLEFFNVGGKSKLGSKVMNIYDELKTIINNDKPEKPIVCEDDDMFYFAVGQLGRYLIGLSKAEKVNYSFLDPILKAKNSTKIKRELISLIKKYSYEIEVWNKQYRSRFDNLQAFVNSYEIGSDENKTDLILAGFASPNLIYSKKEESE